MSGTVISQLIDGCVLLIRLNRPEALNALNNLLLNNFLTALGQADLGSAIRTEMVTGNSKAFAAGYVLSSQHDPISDKFMPDYSL